VLPSRNELVINRGLHCMDEYEFTISLRIRHPTMTPSAVTQELGIEPQHVWQAGEPRRGSAGEQLPGVYRESYWMARLMEQPQLSSAHSSVESVLAQRLSQLLRSLAFFNRISSEGGVAQLHVNLFARKNFGLDLSADSLAVLARLRLAVAIEVHPHTPNNALIDEPN
jgi:hypothetical protein